MYKDIISYKLADGVTEQHLMSVAQTVMNDWMTKQPGFIKWQIHRQLDGSYTDIVYWNSKEDAKQAEIAMRTMSGAAEWIACYQSDSISSVGIELIAEFQA